jgi:hypothetical protein
MKKLLTTIFMAVLAVSAFATVNVETETPTVYHDGSCERVGSMRFIVTNIQDYQSATTDDPIIVEIRLTDAAVLCHDLDGIDDGINNWVSLEVDGAVTGWAADEVKARGLAGANYIEVRIEASPGDGAVSPNTTDQAWFRLGSTVDIFGAPITLNTWTEADALVPLATKDDGTPICVNYTGRVGGADAFMENEFNVISLTTYLGVLGGTQLGISYSPANPAIAYGGPVNTHNLVVDSDCNKFGSDLYTPDVLLCQCYEDDVVDQVTVYDCYDLYRVGVLDLNSTNCDVWLEEDAIGMLTDNAVITFTVVDAAGNPLSTIVDGVYFGQGPSAPNPSLAIGASDITIAGPVWGTLHDAAGTPELSDWNNTSGYVPTDGICDMSGKDYCYDDYDIYESFSFSVTTASTDVPAQLILSDLYLARHTELGPITAYVKVSWAPYPCGAGGSVILPFPINFVDCPPEETIEPEYYPQWIYFTYFPAFADGYWWAGAAVTNATYFAENFGYFPHFHTDQDAMLTFYAIEEDGDIYMLDAGMVVESGISVTLLSDPALSWTYMGANAGEVAFGDEGFWLIVEGMPTLPFTYIWLDGFGMIGNGNEGQGTLPRVGYGPVWNPGIPFNK